MGFFKTLKTIFRLMKDAPKIMEQMEQQRAEYITLPTDQLAALPDEELFSAAQTRIDAIMDTHDEILEGFSLLSDPQKVFFALNYLEMEVNNGGLCQFFVNSSRVLAPYISEYLGIIGATEHKQLFDGFIQKNNIDLSDLSSFKIRHVREFAAQAERYPFDEYDDAFYTLPSLEDSLTAYVKANISAF